MKVDGRPLQSIKIDAKKGKAWILDQCLLPHKVVEKELVSLNDTIDAITTMKVRGAPLIGVAATAGLALACATNQSSDNLEKASRLLVSSRPTAVNLAYAVSKVLDELLATPLEHRRKRAWELAEDFLVEELNRSHDIGVAGVSLIRKIYEQKKRPVTILTHCNAGWLATVDYGTATAPIYEAWGQNIPLEVLADETRPRLQGTLTAWELSKHGVPVKLIADNAGGLLMRQNKVDLIITGADRIASNGDTANKIGTYLKALAAKDNNVPFYIAAPESTFDWSTKTGNEIPIEERDGDEIRVIKGIDSQGKLSEVQIASFDTQVLNPGFDITPVSLISGFITEYGVYAPSDLPRLQALHEKLSRKETRKNIT